MRGGAFLVVFCLISAVAAQTYSSAWKVDKLNELIKQKSTVDLDSRSFEKFVEGPRNFSIIVMMTAMNPKQNCHVCREVFPEYEIVSHSWTSLGHQNRLYFTILDYANGQEIFAKYKFNTAPIILHFAPNEGSFAKPLKNNAKYDQYDIGRSGGEAEDIAIYIQTIVQTDIPVKRPINPVKILSPIILLLLIGFVAKFLYTKVEPFLKNPYVWAVFATTFVLIMIGGQMWNSIRGPPYTGRDEVISGSFQQQFGIETRIISTLYGAGAIGIVGLVLHAPNAKSNNRILVLFYSILFMLAVSLVIFVFRIKNRGYPFKLLF